VISKLLAMGGRRLESLTSGLKERRCGDDYVSSATSDAPQPRVREAQAIACDGAARARTLGELVVGSCL